MTVMWLSLAMVGALQAGSPTSTQHVSGARIAEAVELALTQELAGHNPDARVEVSARVGDQVLPVGTLDIEPGPVAGPWPRRRAGVPVRLMVDGRTARTMTVWVEARDPRRVLAYAADYSARHAGGDLELREAIVDMACCAGTPVTTPSTVRSMRTKHGVRIGAPAMLSDFEAQPDIARQQRIDIEVANGPIRLIAPGIALGDGRVGERIAVRADQSQAVLHGRIATQNKVVVDE